MDIYDLTNYDFKNYNYCERALKAINKTKTLEKAIRIISIILVVFTLIKYLKTDNFSYVILIFALIILLRFIEYKNYKKIQLTLSKEDLDAFHDFTYYFYCKKRSKTTHSMHLFDLIYYNFEKKNYETVLKLLDLLDMTNKNLESRLFLYYYYYAKSYDILGFKEEAKEYLTLLNDLVKRKGLSKTSANIRGLKIVIE